MAQPKPYKYYLRKFVDPDWYYYEIDSSGNVFENISVTELQRAPDGWKENEVSFERGFTWYGMFTAYSTPLKFLKDGAQILRHLMFTEGIEAEVQLLLEKCDVSDYTYETFFIADLDIAKAMSEFDYVVANAMEGGFTAKLKAREDTPYEFDLEGHADVQYVAHDGINLQALLKWSVVNFVDLNAFGASIYPFFTWYDTEGTNLSMSFFDVAPPTTAHFIRNHTGSSIDVDIKVQMQCTITTPGANVNNGYFYLHRSVFDTNSSGTVTGLASSTDIYFGGIQAPGTVVTYSIDQTDSITLASFQIVEYSLNMYLSGGGSSGVDGFETTFTSGTLSVYFVNRFEETYIPTLKAKKVLDLLIDQINDSLAITVTSSLLETRLNNEHFLTSGDGLRTLEGSKLKITFNDFFNWVNRKFGAACWYDEDTNTFYLEAKAVAFDNTVNPDYTLIETVSKFKATPFTQESFVNLKIGSGTFTYDQKGADEKEVTNGKDEFNLTSEWLSPLKRIQGTADYVSPIRCDMYGIEFVRANLSGKELADADSDNEVFVLHCEASNSASYQFPTTGVTVNTRVLYRKAINLTPGASYWEIENIFSPETAYNIVYSPKRSMLANGNYFRSILKFNDADYLKFQVSGKNNANNLKMITSEGSTPDVIDEGLDIEISDLCVIDDLLFQPVLFEFETKEVINLYKYVRNNPFKTLEFPYKGNNYTGFVIQAKSTPTNRGTTTIKLLAAPDTDLTNLIS